MSDEPVQCPECNRWSDRDDYVKLAGENHIDEEVWACLAPDCAAYSFNRDSDTAALLNVEGIREAGKAVVGVKREKLSHYDNIDS